MSAEVEVSKPVKSSRRCWLLFVGIALLLLILLVCYLWANTASLDGLKRFVRYSGIQNDAFSVEIGNPAACVIADDRLCTASQNAAVIYAADGRQISRVDGTHRTPALKSNDSYLLSYDIGDRQLSLLRTDGTVCFSQNTDGNIYDAEVSENGTVAVLTEGANCRAELQVFSKGGALLFQHNSKSRYLGTCAISPDAKYVAVTSLGQEDLRFASSVQIYETESAESFSELALDTQMIYDMAFLEDECICAVGENSIQFFGTDGKLLRKYPMQQGQLSAYRFAQGAVAAAYDLFRGGSALVVLDARGKELAYLEIDETVLHLSTCGNYITVLTDRMLYTYDRTLQLCGSTENKGWRAAFVRSDGTSMCISDQTAILYIPE